MPKTTFEAHPSHKKKKAQIYPSIKPKPATSRKKKKSINLNVRPIASVGQEREENSGQATDKNDHRGKNIGGVNCHVRR